MDFNVKTQGNLLEDWQNKKWQVSESPAVKQPEKSFIEEHKGELLAGAALITALSTAAYFLIRRKPAQAAEQLQNAAEDVRPRQVEDVYDFGVNTNRKSGENHGQIWEKPPAQKAKSSNNIEPEITNQNPTKPKKPNYGPNPEPRTLKPHTYKAKEIPEIEVYTRTYTRDFDGFHLNENGFDVGKITRIHSSKTIPGVCKYKDGSVEIDHLKRGLLIGKDNKGRKIVEVNLNAGRKDFVNRQCFQRIFLVSEPNKPFTQVQRDLIEAVTSTQPDKIRNDSFLTQVFHTDVKNDRDYDRAFSYLTLDRNKLLSEIQEWKEAVAGQNPAKTVDEIEKIIDSGEVFTQIY